MHHDDSLGSLPEALPLRLVSPWWRILALVAMVAVLGLLLLTSVLGIALLQQRSTTSGRFPTGPMMAATPLAPAPATVAAVMASPPAIDKANLPYPVEADLAKRAEVAAEEGAASARTRFLLKSHEVWKCFPGQVPDAITMSPDGNFVAYLLGPVLILGPVGRPEAANEIVVAAGSAARVAITAPGFTQDQLTSTLNFGLDTSRNGRPTSLLSGFQVAGVPAWSANSNAVYLAHADGRLFRIDITSCTPTELSSDPSWKGQWIAPVPGPDEKVVFVRSHAVAKVGLDDKPANDLTEVVLGDGASQTVRTLIPPNPNNWRHLIVSPDGRRLALVSDRGSQVPGPQRWRIFLLDLQGGEPQPVTPPASQYGSVCWTPDGQALVYARSQEPTPPDHAADRVAGRLAALDLYEWNLKTGQEVRLSRGGGFGSPTVTAEGLLAFVVQGVTEKRQPQSWLRGLELAAARQFAAAEPELPRRTLELWTRLVEGAVQEAALRGDEDGAALSPEVLARLSAAFSKQYQALFGTPAPSTAKQFDEQRLELVALRPSLKLWQQLALVIGAAEGEFLRHHRGARWHLVKGPLVSQSKQSETQQNFFATTFNPFLLGLEWPEKAGEPWLSNDLESVVQAAEGRTVILSNDPSACQEVLNGLTDPNLARAMSLFQAKQEEEAEQLLLQLVQAHPKNYHLALQVGRLLFEHNRFPRLLQLMREQCRQEPHDERKYNLLGLAYLRHADRPLNPEANASAAVEAFQNALRCDLWFDPAYLNLAQAYLDMQNIESATACLQRYLELFPAGPYAADAQRRLSAIIPP